MKRSFSLIEVVLACTILILFLMAGLILFGTGIRNIKISQHRMEATYIANGYSQCIQAWKDSIYFNNPGTLPALDPISIDPLFISGGQCGDLAPAPFTREPLEQAELDQDITLNNYEQLVGIKISWTDYNKPYDVKVYTYLTRWQN